MNILVVNDDGIEALGLRFLVKLLSEREGVKVYVSAPESNRSAASHSISTRHAIMLNRAVVSGAEYAETLSGMPADCTKTALKRLKKDMGVDIDVVFSGINHGSNLGTDVYYSGTVGAAAEAVIRNTPAVALSVDSRRPPVWLFEKCRSFMDNLCGSIVPNIPGNTLLNINFPNISEEGGFAGVKITKLGPRDYIEHFDVQKNPRGEEFFWYSGEEVKYEGLSEDTDIMAHQNGYITVTPVKLDNTDYEMKDIMSGWSFVDVKPSP